ncbi:DNA-binding protein Fis [Pseudomonas pohangensis]|jgi:Fis family transcriptional regulator|uniref:Putative Fis-like DNA-binding protein n=2 Tax=Pseudomonas pohangensis TaxID=364197 RepID=A0A1H2GZV0_9PSED|nr:DNA-binding transcriptional regulator Fis [Pseudomonas pohangensis]SDU25132.1 DNA-binding protein Fis [Pseudomonas pohangensis]
MTEQLINKIFFDGASSVSNNLQLEMPAAISSEEVQTLRSSVTKSLRDYFANLEDASVCDLYNLVISEVEAPLLESVMNFVKGNQTRASEMLGLNRGTLRKKLKQYDLL